MFSDMIPIRFVDRDMVMRYYMGFGIGHTYSWSTQPDRNKDNARQEEGLETSDQEQSDDAESQQQGEDEISDLESIDSQGCTPDCESDLEPESEDEESDDRDAELLARYESYGQ